MIELDVFPEGRRCALTMAFDDGEYDDRVLEILNKYGIKGTFFLNSEAMKLRGTYEHIGEMYKGHEVGCHGYSHRHLKYIPRKAMVEEIMEDRRSLEAVTGYPVTGMTYAYGWACKEVSDYLKNLGIEYCRTVGEGGYHAPDDFMMWYTTCHYSQGVEEGKKLMASLGGSFPHPKIFFTWAHGHEFERKNEWDLFEEVCKTVSGDDRIWYATNMEIYRYVTAQRNLVISVDNSMIYNPSATKVWFSSNGTIYSVNPGETLHI